MLIFKLDLNMGGLPSRARGINIIKLISKWLFLFLKLQHSRFVCFFFTLVFSIQLTVQKMSNTWIKTADLCFWKRPHFQLCHSYCPPDFWNLYDVILWPQDGRRIWIKRTLTAWGRITVLLVSGLTGLDFTKMWLFVSSDVVESILETSHDVILPPTATVLSG